MIRPAPQGVERQVRAVHFLKIPSLAKSFPTWEALRRIVSPIFVARVDRRKPIAAFRMAAITSGPESLDSLRSRPDFQLLMMDLAFPANPFLGEAQGR